MPTRLVLLAAAAALSACAAQPPLPPARSTAFPGTGTSRELETPNSLPPGFTTRNPFAPSTGIVGTTRVP